MKHHASDENNARPILSYVIDGKPTRYIVKPHRLKIQSGECKPLGRGPNTNQFICRYTVKPDDIGTFTLKIGKFSRNTADIPLTATYRHEEHLQLGTLKAKEIHIYSDLRKKTDLRDTVLPGTMLYIRVRFDAPIRKLSHLPKLSYKIGDTPREDFQLVDSRVLLRNGQVQLRSRNQSLGAGKLILPEDVTTGDFYRKV